MVEEIDLRPYFETIILNWKWIAATAIVAALLAYVGSSLIEPTYEASSLVIITQPRQRLQFDPRIETMVELERSGAYPELAMSDSVQTRLREVVGLEESETLTSFRGQLRAEAGNDPSLLFLRVHHSDPKIAANTANAWARTFVESANQIYGLQGVDRLRYFEEQLQAAEANLANAEQALSDFQVTNRLFTVVSELESLELAQRNYLQQRQKYMFLLQDVEAMQEHLQHQDGALSVATANQMTILLLEMKAFNVDGEVIPGGMSNTAIPIQFSLDLTTNLIGQDYSEQNQFLSALHQTLLSRLHGIGESVSSLEPSILDLQQQQQDLESELASVTRSYEIAQETHTALARKVEEERITSQDDSNGVRIVSETAVPDNPIGPRKSFNAIISGALGLLSATFVILLIFWRQG